MAASRIAAWVSLISFATLLARAAGAADEAPAASSGQEPLQEVIVTGSLIQRPNNTSVSPISTVSQAVIEQTGASNIQDALNELPSFTVGGNAATGGQGGGGRATINLHGLGTNRNLVLLDGKRLPISDINGEVDINILPAAIISGIDVITGGASAVWFRCHVGRGQFQDHQGFRWCQGRRDGLIQSARRCGYAQRVAGHGQPIR